jgi:hypothetical protein
MMTKSLIVAALVLGGVSAAYAAPITLTFTGLQNLEPIENYYNGGAGGFGSTGGPNYGISFTSNSLALISNEDGGTGDLSRVPAPGNDTAAFFLSGVGDTMNVAGGFTTGFSFYYAAPYYTGTVDVYSGLNGTGTLLASDTLGLTSANCDPLENYSCWVNSGVSFAGTAESAAFSGTANYVAFADITTGADAVPSPSTVTPEPSTLVLLGSGLLGIVGAARRRLMA